ncbi:MAG: lipopolysaccharide biosynthesis protein [Sedimentisphaerales bacterium]|nr:lipopolysaccharide biosynthesis protein [Sedimentisphaerales bacterium]
MTDSEDLTFIDETDGCQQTLYSRAVKGGVWLFALRGVIGFLSFVKQIILLRLLAPTDFGLLGIASLMTIIVLNFTEMGFREALVQRKEKAEDYLDVAWTISVIRGLVLFIILYFAAPYLANFFNRTDAAGVIQVVAISLVINGIVNIGVVYFDKELQFSRRFTLEVSGTVVGTIVVISLAFIYKNVWALVFGGLAGSATRCVLSYVLHPYKPKFSFDIIKLKELWAFGRHVFAIKILYFISLNGDDIFVGKVLGATALGFYRKAYELGNMVSDEIGNKVAQVAFPTFSKLQGNIEKIQGGFFKALQITSLIVFPITGAIIVLSPDFTRLFLTEKWLPMVSSLQILSLLGLLKCMQRSSVFMAIGRPDVLAKLAVLRVTLMAITIYPLTIRYGIAGTSICVLWPSLIMAPIGFYLLEKMVGIKKLESVRILFSPTFATIIMMVCALATKQLTGEVDFYWFILILLQCIAVYVVVILVVSFLGKGFDVFKLIREIINGLK